MPALCTVPTLKTHSISVLTNLILKKLQRLTEDEGNNEKKHEEWESDIQQLIFEHLQNIGAFEELQEILLIRLDHLFVHNQSLRPHIRKLVPKLTGSQIKTLDFSKYPVTADKIVAKAMYYKFQVFFGLQLS